MPEIADVVIVGGGVVGTLLAYELSLRSVRVVVLEANALASGTSGSAFAWINASTKDDDEVYHRFNAEAVARWRTLRERESKLPGIHGGGALVWTQDNATHRNVLRQKASRLASWNYPNVMVSRSEISALETPLFSRISSQTSEAEGVFFPTELWIETGRVVRALAELARKRAAEFREYSPVTGIGIDNAGRVTQVRTAQGSISTRHCLLAAGNATPALLELLPNASECRKAVSLMPAPGILWELSPVETLSTIQRVVVFEDEPGLRLRPTLNGGMLVGSDSIDARLQTEPASVVMQNAEEMLRTSLMQQFALPENTLESVHGELRLCHRVMPADEMPIVGRLPDVEGITVAVTHSGITLAPLIAALLAEETLTGKLPPALRPYTLSRFLQ